MQYRLTFKSTLSTMTCLEEELPLPHLFKKHVNKQTYKISPRSKGPRSAVYSTKAGEPPRYQLLGHNGNLHTRAHLHLDLQGATSPDLLPSPKLCNFPELFLLTPQPWGQPGEGTTGMSSGVAQHHPTDSRCFHSHEITTMEGDSTPAPKAQCRWMGLIP